VIYPRNKIIEITCQQVSPVLKEIFDRKVPTGINYNAVFGVGNAGRIFSGELEHPG
jgi:hypothetical protein